MEGNFKQPKIQVVRMPVEKERENGREIKQRYGGLSPLHLMINMYP